MKYLFLILLLIHGAIHLMGFLKGFHLAHFEDLKLEISKVSAVFWLLAFLLFLVSGITFMLNGEHWFIYALIAVAFSVVLIAANWGEAKFGMIPNVIILVVAAVAFSSFTMDRMVSKERNDILEKAKKSETAAITLEDISTLPAPVKKWILGTGMIGKEAIMSASVLQHAQMKMKPGQDKWHTAIALQNTTTEPPAFIWTVKMNMSPFVMVRGRDKFVDGKGEMLIKLYALFNIVNESGDIMDESTLQRYLGEIVWFPSLSLSPHIIWEAIDENSARATMNYMGTSGSGVFHFDDQGNFVRFVALRYKDNTPGARRYEWVITADEYAIFEGVKVPSVMHATWQLDEGDWTWLKLEISEIRYNPDK